MRSDRFDLALPVVLGFCSGFIEAITYTGLFHTFVTFITGTLMVMIIDLVTGEVGAANKAVVVVSYFVFSIFWLVLSHAVRHGHSERRWVFLATEGVAILVFALVATLLAPQITAGSLATMLVSVIGIFAMSLHGVMFFTMMNASAPSHFMTGNLTQFCRGVVDQFSATEPMSEKEAAETAHRVRHFPLVIVFFVAGVASGVSLFLKIGFVSLAVPGVIVLAAALVARQAWARPG